MLTTIEVRVARSNVIVDVSWAPLLSSHGRPWTSTNQRRNLQSGQTNFHILRWYCGSQLWIICFQDPMLVRCLKATVTLLNSRIAKHVSVGFRNDGVMHSIKLHYDGLSHIPHWTSTSCKLLEVHCATMICMIIENNCTFVICLVNFLQCFTFVNRLPCFLLSIHHRRLDSDCAETRWNLMELARTLTYHPVLGTFMW